MAGEICIANNNSQINNSSKDIFRCSLPAASEQEALDFLEIVGSSGSIGIGTQLWRTGLKMPEIRLKYHHYITSLINEVKDRRRARQSPHQIAQWVVNERRKIANKMRWESGGGTRVIFEIRDNIEYGLGGRTYNNLEKRYKGRGYSGVALDEKLISGASNPNTGMTDTAIKGARYLRDGGRVIVVLSLGITAYTFLTAPQEKLEQLFYQEVGGFAGGALGSGFGVSACFVFGIATSGWGLLACGFVGGIGGGFLGSNVGNRVYRSRQSNIEMKVQQTGVLNSTDFILVP